ncbi:spore germination protein [Ectobacillus ponti]|uniref:Spore germination protein n=1 Tax=Ectobacillus ponti TaxID=2961894 RepID=A0AA41XDE1_9BACI|nr:spore germination protein [Ectobacillus ponti]
MPQQAKPKGSTPLAPHATANQKRITEEFGQTDDFKKIPVSIAGTEGVLLYFSTLVDSKEVSKQVAEALTQTDLSGQPHLRGTEQLEALRRTFLNGVPYQYIQDLEQAVQALLRGNVLLLVEGLTTALGLQMSAVQKRSVVEASTQTVVRGPKDSFVEALAVNKALVRQRLRNPKLRFESSNIGDDTKTRVSIAYIEGKVPEHIVKEVRHRIGQIYGDAILDSGQVEEFITDKAFTLFPTTYSTERPDTACLHLIQGKVAVLVDGSPFVLTVPTVFNDFFQVSEDYYQPFLMSSFLRIIRYLAYFISLLLPGLYVALTTYHYELVPTPLLVSIISQRENVPFPAVVELFIMEITFEILREAGVRMPRAVGQTVSIVGALVIGQAAVEAGVVSTVMVIVVSLTAIASFVSPIYSFSSSSRLLRFLVALGAGVLGLYGILLVTAAMIIHLVSLRSFGVPYFAPIAPLIEQDQKDVFLRMPAWALTKGYRTFRLPFHVNRSHTSTPISDHQPEEES